MEEILKITKELCEQLDAIDWSKAGKMTDWLGGPDITITSGMINAKEIML